jgi:hypothetical protein
MTYLELARSALRHCEQSEKSPSAATSRPREASSGCEISEQSEKSPGFESGRSSAAQDEAELLKLRIIAVVTVDPAAFDRELYDLLMAEWAGYEASLASHADEVGGL